MRRSIDGTFTCTLTGLYSFVDDFTGATHSAVTSDEASKWSADADIARVVGAVTISGWRAGCAFGAPHIRRFCGLPS
jgi:hypothetical protein